MKLIIDRGRNFNNREALAVALFMALSGFIGGRIGSLLLIAYRLRPYLINNNGSWEESNPGECLNFEPILNRLTEQSSASAAVSGAVIGLCAYTLFNYVRPSEFQSSEDPSHPSRRMSSPY